MIRPKHKLAVQRIVAAPGSPTNANLYHWLMAALEQQCTAVEVVIRIVGEAEITDLNQQYRNQQGPTNVLSFPFVAPPQMRRALLGDIVICAPLVVKEAAAQNKDIHAHWAHLVIHGVLHLLGHDHQNEADAQIMEDLERKILAQLGYSDPYA